MSVFSKIKEAFVKSEDKDKYLSGLDRSKKSFGDRMRALSNNFHGIDDDLLEQIMVILLESDVGIHTAQKIVDAFESNGKHVKEYDSMLDYLVSILYDFYDESNDEPIKMNEEGPTVILMVGVNGSGKTTTSAKLIQYYKEQGKKVAVAAADTFRAGAIDQIDTWATRLGVHCVKGKMNQDPSSVLVDACRYAKENDIEDYVSLIQAIMMQESGGKGNDPMQASESGYNTKYPRVPNGITEPEYSIDVGTHTFSDCVKKANVSLPIPDAINIATTSKV